MTQTRDDYPFGDESFDRFSRDTVEREVGEKRVREHRAAADVSRTRVERTRPERSARVDVSGALAAAARHWQVAVALIACALTVALLGTMLGALLPAALSSRSAPHAVQSLGSGVSIGTHTVAVQERGDDVRVYVAVVADAKDVAVELCTDSGEVVTRRQCEPSDILWSADLTLTREQLELASRVEVVADRELDWGAVNESYVSLRDGFLASHTQI